MYDLKGFIRGNTFTDENGEELLRSISMDFSNNNLFNPSNNPDGVNYINFYVLDKYFEIIKNVFFNK